MPNGLHTTFCHKCGKTMSYPFEEAGELYHKQCLPSIFAFADEEYDKYLENHVHNPNNELQKVAQPDLATGSIDEACKYLDPEVWNIYCNLQPWSVL